MHLNLVMFDVTFLGENFWQKTASSGSKDGEVPSCWLQDPKLEARRLGLCGR